MERVLEAKGLHGASMTAIAREAGMSKRTLYLAFESRAALFEACVRRIRASLVRPLDEHERRLPLAQRLRRLLMPEARNAARNVPLVVLRAVVAEAERHPDLARAFLREGPHEARRVIRDELDHAVARGELALADTEMAAQLLCGMVYESPVERLIDPDLRQTSPAEIEARLELAIAIFLHGSAGRSNGSPPG